MLLFLHIFVSQNWNQIANFQSIRLKPPQKQFNEFHLQTQTLSVIDPQVSKSFNLQRLTYIYSVRRTKQCNLLNCHGLKFQNEIRFLKSNHLNCGEMENLGRAEADGFDETFVAWLLFWKSCTNLTTRNREHIHIKERTSRIKFK